MGSTTKGGALGQSFAKTDFYKHTQSDRDIVRDIVMNYTDYDNFDPLFPPDMFTPRQLRKGAVLLHVFGALITLVAAVVINNRFVVESLKIGVDKIGNRRLRSVLGKILVGGARSFPKLVVALQGHYVAYSDIGLASVLGAIAFTLHVVVGLGLIDFKRHFGTHKEVLLNCLLLLVASGFVWTLLTQSSTPRYVPRYFSASASLILYLIVALLPLCYKVDEEEGELPLHEQGKEGVQNEPTDSPKPLNLFQSPPGILRSQGSSLICLFSWCEYVATLVTALLPSFSMFCCDPLNRPNTRLWPLAFLGGAAWVTGLLYLNVWLTTNVGETWGMPPELMGLVFIGPVLGSSALPLLSRPTFVLQENTEIFLNDILHGVCLPTLIYMVIRSGEYPVQSWESSDLVLFNMQVTILLTHLIFICTNSSCSSSGCSVFQGVALIGSYVFFFLPSIIGHIYGFFVLPI